MNWFENHKKNFPSERTDLAELAQVDAGAALRRDELLAVLRGGRRDGVRPHQHHDLGQRVVVVVRPESAIE